MSRAYAVSVLGMLAMPFLLLGAIGFMVWRSAKAAPKAPPPPPPPSA